MRKIIAKIEQADDVEIRRIMDAVEQRYALAYPDWDVVYIAMHKDPTLRKGEMQELVAFLEKDLQWHEQEAKKDSLG